MDTRRLLFWVNIVLVLAIILSAVALLTSLGNGPSPVTTPTGSISDVDVTSRTSVKVILGNCSQATRLTDCSIVVTSPDNQRSVTKIKPNVMNYPLTLSATGLSNLKVSTTDVIVEGVVVSLDNYQNLQLGSWSFKLIYEPTGGTVIERKVIVPDTANTPIGTFSDVLTISGSEVKLVFGIISPATAPSFCSVIIKVNDTTESFDLTAMMTTSYRMADGTVVQYVDSGGDGIINANDYISINRDGPLRQGQWSLRIIYNYTDERITSTIFQVGNSS